MNFIKLIYCCLTVICTHTGISTLELKISPNTKRLGMVNYIIHTIITYYLIKFNDMFKHMIP